MVTAGTRYHEISRITTWIKENYRTTVRLEDLANMAGMSPSSFHSHFKDLTTMTPLQFQKKLRLNQARKLMLTEKMDAASASFEVGYESASQFSREYRRHFGASPIKDIQALIQTTVE